MAEKLTNFFEEAKKLGGLKAKMRLAVLTDVSSVKAPSEPDSSENIKKFDEAMKELKKEFK